jgi:hypothetical protein
MGGLGVFFAVEGNRDMPIGNERDAVVRLGAINPILHQTCHVQADVMVLVLF